MSGAARHRGRARGQPGDGSEGSPRRGRGNRGGRRGVTPFDGPASRGTSSVPGSHGRPGSNPPSSAAGSAQGGIGSQDDPATSRRSSISQTPSQVPQQGEAARPMAGLDPARDKPKSKFETMKNIDFPAPFYNLDFKLETQFARRPAFNSTGKPINLPLNSYQVTGYPKKTIYQYDVVIGTGDEKRAVIRKVWASKVRQELTGPPAIFDGNKIAWSLTDYGPEARRMVDLNVEEGRPSAGDKNVFRLLLKRSRKLDIGIIEAYLAGRIQYNIQIAEAVNFMDHLLREGPSTNPNMVAVKRSFFVRRGERADLGGGIEVIRGIYQSMRLAEGQKLVINLDVSNTCFWKPGRLINLILQKNNFRDVDQLRNALQNRAAAMATFKFINKLTVKADYRGNKLPNKEWKIKALSGESASSRRIAWRDPQTGKETEEKITIAAYFKRKYNLQLQYPGLPLIEMTKKDVEFPMELLVVIENQRYGSKLNELQTAAMIKFAVSPPNTRSRAIEEGKGWLDWQNDKYLQNYGLSVNNQQIVTQARVLPSPGIRFGRGRVEQPGTKGRWDLRGKQFLTGNPQELVAWSIGFFDNGRVKMDKPGLEKFALDFAKAYRNHGGVVAGGLPLMMKLQNDAGKAVEELYNATGNRYNRKPQLMIFLVQNKDSMHYLRIKKSCDCRYGINSQVMQFDQVRKGNPQYYSNVLMKVNAKLGGCTSQAVPAPTSGFKNFTIPTMIIGADVSHASPGSEQPSMAALTVSFDKHAGRYASACQTNGFRVEMITEDNMRSMLRPLVQQWSSNIGGGALPSQVYYLRDGVSEGQFQQVIQQEVPMIKAVMNIIANGRGWNGKVTVIIASKRHHIRAFPKQGDGDQKGNPLPGTLIERDVTMPNEWDFYLYSHIALQGTSRPVHYTVIHDESNHQANFLQNMIYEHCYQYMRSTTSVSLHPAVYYAHLASNRAKAHEDISATVGTRGGPGYKVNQPHSSETSSSQPAPLLKLKEDNGIHFSMWYI